MSASGMWWLLDLVACFVAWFFFDVPAEGVALLGFGVGVTGQIVTGIIDGIDEDLNAGKGR